jgi:hypothetical protein
MSEGSIIRTEDDADNFIWKTPYLAFLDILGFKELIKNNSHSEVVNLYKALINTPVEFYSKYNEQEQTLKKERLGEHFRPTGLRLVNISDSIMLWTKNSRESSLIDLISAVKVLMSTSISMGIPLRGSIVMGNFEIMEQELSLSIVGRALVHAYENENKQNWSGCTIDSGIISFLKSYQKVINNREVLLIETLNSLMVEAIIPFKSGHKKGYVVNWANNTDYSEDQIRESFSKYNKRLKETEEITKSIEEKITNTVEFYKEFGGKKQSQTQ